MKYALISLSALSLATLPAVAETQAFQVDPFSGIDVKGGIKVFYETGPETSVIVEQADGDFSDIRIKTDDGELEIGRDSLGFLKSLRTNLSVDLVEGDLKVKVNGKQVPSYTVRVISPSISELDVAQSSILTASGLDSDEIELDASSSAKLIVTGRAASAELDASSSSLIDASGLLAGAIEIEATSSADVKARAVTASRAEIQASSSSDVELQVESTSDVDVDASSSADVVLIGTCNKITVDASSSAGVKAGELACKSADVEASSSSDVVVNASEALEASVSSGGDIEVLGAPTQTDVRKSSGGNISIKS
jgi:Putative auto-transporter adhesin, head GIN domain